MNAFLGELIGTALMILLGNGVVANVLLKKTKGNGGGLIVITFGWAIAVFMGVFVSAAHSGAHLNPAITIALALLGKFSWSLVAWYILAQLLGAMLGAFLVWVVYLPHFNATDDADLQLACFSTAPAIPNKLQNLTVEIIGTFVLVFTVLSIAAPASSLGALDALPVTFIVLGIGLSLGGPTGYAINPARDLGPRIIHSLVPINGKRSANWNYSWIPILGPIMGAALAAGLYSLLN